MRNPPVSLSCRKTKPLLVLGFALDLTRSLKDIAFTIRFATNQKPSRHSDIYLGNHSNAAQFDRSGCGSQ